MAYVEHHATSMCPGLPNSAWKTVEQMEQLQCKRFADLFLPADAQGGGAMLSEVYQHDTKQCNKLFDDFVAQTSLVKLDGREYVDDGMFSYAVQAGAYCVMQTAPVEIAGDPGAQYGSGTGGLMSGAGPVEGFRQANQNAAKQGLRFIYTP